MSRPRSSEALERFDEAVEIRRRLASANPDPFEADLATSLNNQAAMLSVVGGPRESLTAIEEALHMMVPKLEVTPDLLPDGGWRILRAYIRLHQQLQTEPDHALINRHIAVLKTVEGCSTFGPRQVTAEDSVPQVRQLGLQEEQR